jgi:hypothetical protein
MYTDYILAQTDHFSIIKQHFVTAKCYLERAEQKLLQKTPTVYIFKHSLLPEYISLISKSLESTPSPLSTACSRKAFKSDIFMR